VVFEVRHSRCVRSLTKNYYVLHIQSNTTTCFGPICWPSSGCDLTYRAAIQDVWGVLLGYWGVGEGGRDLIVSIVGTMT